MPSIECTGPLKCKALRKLAHAIYREVQVGKDQEKAQSEKDFFFTCKN